MRENFRAARGRSRRTPAAGRRTAVAAVRQPVGEVVFVLDGVLIGASECRYLAIAAAFMLARMGTPLARLRTGAWLVVGPGGRA